ncbi:MAG TPA: 6-pyruvoyl-tetrahydropterin synthase-related protein [Blastocatellia bacterium]|nr:6-pyruvoyl-tetrahydropterin synthase-related protein [Blastocatellia bacterium]
MNEREPTTAKPTSVANEKPSAAKERRNRILIGVLCIGLSSAAVVPFFFMGRCETGDCALKLRMPTTHDMFLHYDQMRSFYNGLAAGEIYPRWEEDTNRGFGAPTTSYYPPGVYYLTSVLYSLTRDWMRVLLVAHLVMMIAAAGFLYLYARQSMGRRAAVAAMAAYIFLPYHLLDQYQRGAMAELLVFAWMPLMLLFGERLMESRSRGGRQRSKLLSIVGLAATYGAFLWSHPPTAYQFTLGFGLYMLALGLLRKEWKGFVVVGLAMGLGIGLAAVYLLPAAIEQNLIHKEYITETWPYHKTYIFVHDLYNSDVHSGFFKLIDAIWISGTAVIVVAAVTLLWLKRQALSAAQALRQSVLLWVILGALASFMMISASMPVGKLIPKIDIGVFTWRMLSITTLVVALFAGAFTQAAIDSAARGSRSGRALFALLAAVIVFGNAGLSAIAVARPMIDAVVFEPEPEHLNWATIPSSAPADPGELPDNAPEADLAFAETGKIVVEEWKPQHRVVRTSLTEDDTLRVRTFNFPGWTASVDGQQVPIRSSEDLGSIEIDLRAGAHRVTLDFIETKPRRTFRVVSLCSLACLIVLAFAPLVRLKKSG